MSTIENIVKSLAYATEHNQGLHLTHEEVPALNACIAKLRKALIRIEEEYYSNGTWEETADDMYELANDALLNDKESIVNG